MTNHTHKQSKNSVEFIEDAFVMGKLMAVDWTNKTARLERFSRKSVKLRFSKELDEDMRHFATQFVKITGKGYLKAPDTDAEEWVSIEVENVSLPYEGGGKPKIFRSADTPNTESPFKSNEELQDFIQVIHEGRHI